MVSNLWCVCILLLPFKSQGRLFNGELTIHVSFYLFCSMTNIFLLLIDFSACALKERVISLYIICKHIDVKYTQQVRMYVQYYTCITHML